MPRSPSRDRSDRFFGFRGYVRVPDNYARAKSLALLAAGVLVGLWVVVEAASPRAGAFHTHGALANPHSAWDNDCAACHKQHGLGDFSLSNIFDARDRWHDLTCTKCHAAPPHHATVKDTAFHDKCSNCHHDHGGRDNSLVRLTDEHCVRCHANLPEAHVSSDPGSEKTITSFAAAHPEFKALREYPGAGAKEPKDYAPRKLKFSHAVHMTPGLITGMTLDKIAKLSDAEMAKRYSDNSTPEGIALNCAACHMLDAQVPLASVENEKERVPFDQISALLKGQAKASILPPRAEGAYYLPVNFDASCKACHPTSVPGGTISTDGGKKSLEIKAFAIPHRLQMAEAEPLLRGGYWAQLAKEKLAVAGAEAKLPVGRLDPPPPALDVVATYGGEIDRLTRQGLAWMVTDPQPEKNENRPAITGAACAKCHFFSGVGKTAKVEQLPQQTVWFAHAKFDHVSHRGLTCASCHPGTDKPATPPATRLKGTEYEPEPIAILGIESCRACHAPAGGPVLKDDNKTAVTNEDGRRAGAAGIRHSCTDCHRYHNGDRPLHGMGSPLRDPKHPQSLADFLGGGKSATGR